MNKIILTLSTLVFLAMIAYMTYFGFMNPQLTRTELSIYLWKYHAIAVGGAFISGLCLIKLKERP